MHSLTEKPGLSKEVGVNRPIDGESLLFLMQEVLSKGASFRFQAKGWSMAPFIKHGDTITIAPIIKEKPAVGKVVAFIQPDSGRLIIHRVIGRQGAAYLIKGDNTAGQPDELVPAEDILGCVMRVEHDGHRVYLGLGPERYLMAVLSRYDHLTSVFRRLRTLKYPFRR